MPSKRSLLEERYLKFNVPGFIKDDPVCIPHRFTKKEDIEISGFLVALIAWGQRKSILNSGNRLLQIFDHSPHDFILNHRDSDLKACLKFVHRTFNGEDLLSLISFLQEIYTLHGGLESAFSMHLKKNDLHIENALIGFRELYVKSLSFLKRSGKHIASPAAGSACKRLNMFLRWMVRKDDKGVDFGIWNSIKPSQLICPLDVHVIRQAHSLQLIRSTKSDWKTALELTSALRRFDAKDPVKYDFALFGEGVGSSY